MKMPQYLLLHLHWNNCQDGPTNILSNTSRSLVINSTQERKITMFKKNNCSKLESSNIYVEVETILFAFWVGCFGCWFWGSFFGWLGFLKHIPL